MIQSKEFNDLWVVKAQTYLGKIKLLTLKRKCSPSIKHFNHLVNYSHRKLCFKLITKKQSLMQIKLNTNLISGIKKAKTSMGKRQIIS